MFRGYLLIALALAALAAAGCGSEEEAEPPERKPETAQPVPKLPRGWTVQRNDNAGFAFGVPPGWSAKNKGTRSEVLSPDRLVAATIAADRSDEALEFPLREFAQTAITGVAGLRKLKPGETKRFGHRYDGVVIDGEGVGGKEDIRQRVDLIVLRREGVVTFTVLVARNAEQPTAAYVPDVTQMIRSLRSRPPG